MRSRLATIKNQATSFFSWSYSHFSTADFLFYAIGIYIFITTILLTMKYEDDNDLDNFTKSITHTSMVFVVPTISLAASSALTPLFNYIGLTREEEDAIIYLRKEKNQRCIGIFREGLSFSLAIIPEMIIYAIIAGNKSYTEAEAIYILTLSQSLVCQRSFIPRAVERVYKYFIQIIKRCLGKNNTTDDQHTRSEAYIQNSADLHQNPIHYFKDSFVASQEALDAIRDEQDRDSDNTNDSDDTSQHPTSESGYRFKITRLFENFKFYKVFRNAAITYILWDSVLLFLKYFDARDLKKIIHKPGLGIAAPFICFLLGFSEALLLPEESSLQRSSLPKYPLITYASSFGCAISMDLITFIILASSNDHDKELETVFLITLSQGLVVQRAIIPHALLVAGRKISLFTTKYLPCYKTDVQRRVTNEPSIIPDEEEIHKSPYVPDYGAMGIEPKESQLLI